ncbi:MAG TPA: YafY family protein [Dictyobacter sp.]|jgi:predicted DNA-binding transcriptional regulator YafY|nr:YafY family protein [Dictyobacter sp.]
MYFPTTRVLTVLELLQSRQKISGRELSERLEVDIRTVRRYVTMLQDLGIPVESERGRYGSYRLRPGFKLPPLMFTDDEALAITLGLLMTRKVGLAMTEPAVEGALAKIERVLPVTIRDRVQALQDTLTLDLPSPASMPPAEVVVSLSIATQRRQCVTMRYQAYEAQETERVVDPYGLVYRSGFWYMVGFCHLRLDIRNFRLDRIVAVQICDEKFQRPDNFDCLDVVLRSISQTPGKWLVEILLETTLEEARHMVPPALATLDLVENGVLFRCFTNSLDWMARIVVSFCCPFTIRQPAELRDALRQLAQQMIVLADDRGE